MAQIRTYRDLIVWQRAMGLAESGYLLSAEFPPDERFGLTSQLRRARVSVPSNIAEGHASEMRGLYLRHLRVAAGSLAEVQTQVMLATRFKFVTDQQAQTILSLSTSVAKLLNGLLRSLKRGRPKRDPDRRSEDES
jgi:four helix bundle protein